jgi:hypothetical protein
MSGDIITGDGDIMKKLIALTGLVVLALAGTATPAATSSAAPGCVIVAQWC